MENKKLLIIGLGVLGSNILDMISRTNMKHKIIFGGKDPEKMKERVNLAELVANKLGYSPKLSVCKVDLDNIEETIETLDRLKPDIIFNATSLMSYWVPTTLPKEDFAKLYYAYTGWQTPTHLTLTYKLMKAVKLSSLDIKVINASYPDVVNPALRELDLSPHVGIGNVSNIVPTIKKAIALATSFNITDIEVFITAHHHFSYKLPNVGNSERLPHHIAVTHKGKDITSQIDLDTIYSIIPEKLKRTRGLVGMSMTAASSMNIILEFLNETGRSVHAPGVNGLPGGYPIRITQGEMKVDFKNNLTLERALEINQLGQVLDGVKEIKDGRVVFTEREMEVVKQILGYECHSMKIEECEYWAKETLSKMDEKQRSRKLQLI
ncbi:hypothetical protein AB3N04_00710 (plasmid) [Alkalihalophilus sp. As8PL]|uniref:Saccharopine dehydrogenase NADP binding domain-containing protein n=1 Tax=Alkalihalophilus sp. As8PL TaxID=3237103 RepID=A0AB39BNL5_9BACI